jgi:outer membrane protein OmpA-like peptidoglycan-associated protein/tetratricopeptide (TPR) repeat protein
MKKIICFLFLLVISVRVFSQKASYTKNFTEGNYLLLEKNYSMALESFQLAYMADSSSANINYKIGLCYMNLPSKKKKAMPYMEKAIAHINKNYHEDESGEKGAPKDATYWYAKALHLAGKFDQAITEFEKYKGVVGTRNKEIVIDVQRQIESCKNAIEFTKNPENITIKNLGDSINTEYPEYGPVINADESVLMYTSRRPGSKGGERGPDGSYYEDIYLSKRKTDGNWSYPGHLVTGLNSSSNEATIGLSADGQKLYIYKDDNGGDIYYSKLNGELWSTPVPFGEEVNSPSFESHLTVSLDSNTMYFSSERPGGYGGVDLYRCTRLPNGKWSKAYRLDSTINTKFNEDAPYIHPDGKKLFFSSAGHNSMGGLDIFYTLISTDSVGNIVYSKPVNLKAPMNTPDDDEFYVPTADGTHAYFSSAREGGFGDQDIYVADLPKEIQVDPLVLLKGIITFDGGHDRPDKVEINIFDAATSELVAKCKPNATTGKYLAILNPGLLGKKFILKYEATGFQPISQTVDVLPGSAYRVVEKEVEFEFINMESKSATTISMGGLITNEDMESIVDVEIIVKDNNTGELLKTYTTSSDVGYYYLVLDRGRNYNISFQAPGYLFQSQNVDIPKKAESQHVEIIKSIKLEHIQKGVKMILNNIFFDKDKATLRKQSMLELETVYKLLKEKSDLIIEVSGYTDNHGSDAINKKLSLDRAKAVVTFLTKKGIPSKQLIAKGYGKENPIASNTLENGKPDLEGMQKNRRVEIKIEDSK